MGIALVVMLAVSCTGQMLQVDLFISQQNQRRLICRQQILGSPGVFRDVTSVAVEWYRSGAPVMLDSRVSASGASLVIMQPGPEDEDNYACCINNRAVCSGNRAVRSE